MAGVHELHARWPKLPHEERRHLVELLGKEITVGNGEISLSLSYLPSFEKLTHKQLMSLYASHSLGINPR